jgi:hypothetical protein
MSTIKTIKRDANGLIQGSDYKFTDEGRVDWKQMIPLKFLYVNNDPKNREKIEKKYGKAYSEINPIIDNVADTDLIIMLAGINYILAFRGFNKVIYTIKESSPSYASVNCMIGFSPNFETENQYIEYSENACATPENTTNFARNYLVEMATNRAFCRAVRRFLNINIVSKEELGLLAEEPSPVSAPLNEQMVDKLQKMLAKSNITFDQLKIKLINEKFEGAEKITKLSDLPKDKIFELIERIKKVAKE